MKFKFLVFALAIAGIACIAHAAKDPVLMKINGKEVKLSEFEYLYNKNLQQQVNKESIDEYVNRFVDYKLKVVEAESLGYDTLPRINRELDGYKNDLIAPFMTDTVLQEKLAREDYERKTKNVNMSHMMLALGKNKEETQKQIALMDSLRTCILNGENFSDIVEKYSIDRSKVNNHGEYGFQRSGVLPYDFEKVAFNTPVGTISAPFVTQYGVHMVRVNGVRPDEGEVQVGHILKLFPRNATDSAKQAVKHQIDSIYQRVLAGEDFEELARKCSQDPGSARNGGKLPFFGRGRMVKAFENVAFDLPDGQISAPVETPYGYHIVKKYSHKALGTYEEMRPLIIQQMQNDERSIMPIESKTQQIMKELNYKPNEKLGEYLKKELTKHGGFDSTFVTDVVAKSQEPIFTYGKGIKVPLKELASRINAKSKYANNDIASAEIVGLVENYAKNVLRKHYGDNLVDLNPDYRNLLNEYRDGTLLFEVMNKEVWSKAKTDEDGLEAYYKANSGKYSWDAPHFKGIMICAKNDSILKEALTTAAQWSDVPVDTLTSNLNNKFGRNIKMLRVISKKGDDAMVDNIAFGEVKGVSSFNGYPVYAKLTGKIISQPEEMSDVRGMVSSDYQDELEKRWIDGLHKKYKVVIDKKVLKQVKAKY